MEEVDRSTPVDVATADPFEGSAQDLAYSPSRSPGAATEYEEGLEIHQRQHEHLLICREFEEITTGDGGHRMWWWAGAMVGGDNERVVGRCEDARYLSHVRFARFVEWM